MNQSKLHVANDLITKLQQEKDKMGAELVRMQKDASLSERQAQHYQTNYSELELRKREELLLY